VTLFMSGLGCEAPSREDKRRAKASEHHASFRQCSMHRLVWLLDLVYAESWNVSSETRKTLVFLPSRGLGACWSVLGQRVAHKSDDRIAGPIVRAELPSRKSHQSNNILTRRRPSVAKTIDLMTRPVWVVCDGVRQPDSVPSLFWRRATVWCCVVVLSAALRMPRIAGHESECDGRSAKE
jgi:hypothetical protein